jgi:hypothetical protein
MVLMLILLVLAFSLNTKLSELSAIIRFVQKGGLQD